MTQNFQKNRVLRTISASRQKQGIEIGFELIGASGWTVSQPIIHNGDVAILGIGLPIHIIVQVIGIFGFFSAVLYDEAIEYEKHLQQAGVKVMLIQTKGTVHGFELNWKSAYTQEIIRQRIAYMKEQFSE